MTLLNKTFLGFSLLALVSSLTAGLQAADRTTATKTTAAKTQAKAASTDAKKTAPIRALLITGGCCHDYPFQARALTRGIARRANVTWKVINEGGRGTKGQIKLYSDPDWAKPYDIVIHNECFANTTDEKYVKRITEAHKAGVPSIVIHCAMHTYRAAKFDDWREFLGVTSKHHEHQSKYPVKVVAKNHPIMKTFPKDWVTPKDELYVIEKLWPNATVLATSKSERTGKEHPVFWTNTFGKAKVFGTTYGHTNETMASGVFLDTLTKGLLWVTDNLDKSGKPKPGYESQVKEGDEKETSKSKSKGAK